MNKWFLIPAVLSLTAFTPIYDTHDSTGKTDFEFKEVEQTTQPKQWETFASTPTLNDLEENQFVKVSSNGVVSIMCRDGNEIYAVKMSCVTVIR